MQNARLLAVPVLSILIIISLAARPETTGLATAGGSFLNADVRVTITEGAIIPLDSSVNVTVDYESVSVPIGAFITESGGPYEIVNGSLPEIGYVGPGFAGNTSYVVPLARFGMEAARKMEVGIHRVLVKITYNGSVISEAEREIVI